MDQAGNAPEAQDGSISGRAHRERARAGLTRVTRSMARTAERLAAIDEIDEGTDQADERGKGTQARRYDPAIPRHAPPSGAFLPWGRVDLARSACYDTHG
jgi:hypothetical protein